ncbi:E3 ubiquitin-protein ligase UHRF1-like [Gordionus sp. m RMFG-2023]|uniref:E3 ubiquitin-protein ligase UHRF1-like n=1 Tax=Gordionus sp. m RMFG-2023 TaxID=3053472 RepID=UPI0031FDF74E
MWIRIRTFDAKRMEVFDGLSKLTKIKELKMRISKKFLIEVDHQRLFYRGKQLEDSYSLYDYEVGLNEIIQLMVKENILSSIDNPKAILNEEIDDNNIADKEIASIIQLNNSGDFKIKDAVDVKDEDSGAWFESVIINIYQKNNILNSISETIIKVQYIGYDKIVDIPISNEMTNTIRFRSSHLLSLDSLNIGQIVLVNYNIDKPQDRGYWYECSVSKKSMSNRRKDLYVDINLGNDEQFLTNCKIQFCEEIYEINKSKTQDQNDTTEHDSIKPIRKLKYGCDKCKDDPKKNCKDCHCTVCGRKNNLDKQIMCDECDLAYHSYCLEPPMHPDDFPLSDEDWYCPACKLDSDEIIKPGDGGKLLKSILKRAKDALANSAKRLHSSHDWGKGMACVGRTRICTIVPSNHFGPIPGISVGTSWKFRLQVSECGVHRPHVAGIHGREEEGAYSIVFSGGYEDDEDFGDEFYYTGSGGRDLSGNKRTAVQSCDQKLTKYNKSLAKNCDCPLNDNIGGEANNWRAGLPLRVVRNYKARKFSKFSPKEGNRYDGIYKVVKYWPQTGKAGYKVWRYLLRRDDTTPAPWTKEGKALVSKLNLTLQYPEGYTKGNEDKKALQEELLKSDSDSNPGNLARDETDIRIDAGKENLNGDSKHKLMKVVVGGLKSRTRRSKGLPGPDTPLLCENDATGDIKIEAGEREDSDEWNDIDVLSDNDGVDPKDAKGELETKNEKSIIKKAPKLAFTFKLPPVIQNTIDGDTCNRKLWVYCMEFLQDGIQPFLQRVTENFECICCKELICNPITTKCNHNICKECLERAFKADIHKCPTCRIDLGKNYKMSINENLRKALLHLFPGYDKGR